MVFLQNVTVSLAHKEAHAHHGASGHYFRNGIKCWQSLCLCLHRATTLTCGCTQAVTQALGQDWLGAPEGAAGSSWAVSEAASPGRSNPASSLLPNFMRLKNTQKHICVVISKVQPQKPELRQAGCDTPPAQPTCRDSILSMQIMTSESKFLDNNPNTLTQTSLTLIRLCHYYPVSPPKVILHIKFSLT